MEENIMAEHKITMSDRQVLDVTGVLNVERFTDEDVILETQKGMLNIKGEKMHMKELNLDGGIVVIKGLIKSLSYTSEETTKEKGKGILKRMFK
ncbi:MAG TPA: sporulation protein YabP [Thermoanaerobacterales bacterium]|jgi:sporulation protein YabP|nr:sporulation protein YabP [Thermoanaerobacterales bacterium]